MVSVNLHWLRGETAPLPPQIWIFIILILYPQTAILLLRIDDIISGSKKGKEEGGGGVNPNAVE